MVVDFLPPETLLAQLIELRKAVMRDAAGYFTAWRPLIWRSSFRSAAWNLAYYLALRRRDAQKLERALMPWGLSSLNSGISCVLPHLDGTIASLGAVCRINPTLLPQHPSPRAFFRGERLLKRHTHELFGDRQHSHHWIVPCPNTPLDSWWFEQLQEQGVSALRLDLQENPEQAQAAIAQFQAHQSSGAMGSPKPCKLWLTLAPQDLEGDRPRASQNNHRHGNPNPQLAQALEVADIIELSQIAEPQPLEFLHKAIQKQIPPEQPRPGVIVSLDPDIHLEQLPELIVRGAGRYPFGIAIPPTLTPKGHLCDRSRAYQKILDLCQAACIPVILMPPREMSPSSGLDRSASQLAAIVRSPLQLSPSSATS
ncbi:hypothetical protein [Sodalinema gerasimenkoae]|uniref:hypothetical protein n=1 Tax=Sodalinema gerasimenkoae TaxID=2862348 RepID=UPI001358870F|nr:hypothetical protein [Sodalinema gerasimenkoae]